MTAGLLAASPASADVLHYAGSCDTNQLISLARPGASTQCFYYTGSGSKRLNVNDWYAQVGSGSYKISVHWHDQNTQKNYDPDPVLPHNWAYQPTPNCILYAIDVITS
jgi:hypothetical protein